mmetsp:Transcript_38440/g.75473  ORF Transcript_38440/g.75473 Transcript_38440/m.75473 type:complete len:98 (+) Transcript_38440:1-294(+)
MELEPTGWNTDKDLDASGVPGAQPYQQTLPIHSFIHSFFILSSLLSLILFNSNWKTIETAYSLKRTLVVHFRNPAFYRNTKERSFVLFFSLRLPPFV